MEANVPSKVVASVLAAGIMGGVGPVHSARSAYGQQSPGASRSSSPAPRLGDPKLPPDEDQAKTALEKSPRHAEWVDVKRAEGPSIRAFIVYPERKSKAPVVIVIHEIFGLSDWVRGTTDQLAKEGFVAVAPDLISGMGPGGGGTDSLPGRDDVTKLIRSLSPEEADARIGAVREYALRLPASNGRSATIGFCWGGFRSFGYAALQPALNAAIVYYGAAPAPGTLGSLKAPVLGLYAGDDSRINATIEATAAELARLGRTYERETFEGAGHGFLRAQTGRDGANMKATQKAWPRTIAFLKKYLEP